MSDAGGGKILDWAWDRRDQILEYLERLKKWFLGEEEPKPQRDILILGAGGVGKTTLARFLSEPLQFPLGNLWEYRESVRIERFTFDVQPPVELVVAPGQNLRRAVVWDQVLDQIRDGGYRGIILVSAHGYHNFMVREYQNHSRYAGNKQTLIEEVIAANLEEERQILKQVLGAIETSAGRFWMLSVICKADLWWKKFDSISEDYRSGSYGQEFSSLSWRVKADKLRHEVAFASLVIQTMRTESKQLLVPNVEGFDQPLQFDFLRQLLEKLDALRAWEAAT